MTYPTVADAGRRIAKQPHVQRVKVMFAQTSTFAEGYDDDVRTQLSVDVQHDDGAWHHEVAQITLAADDTVIGAWVDDALPYWLGLAVRRALEIDL